MRVVEPLPEQADEVAQALYKAGGLLTDWEASSDGGPGRRLRLPDPAQAETGLAGGAEKARATGSGKQVLPVREAQMYIPHKPWQRAVLISLSTPAISDWDAYARIFIRIGMSVRFAAAEASAAG